MDQGHARTLSQIVDRELGYDDDELEGLACSPSRHVRRSYRKAPTLWQRFCAVLLCAWVNPNGTESPRRKSRQGRKRNPSPLQARPGTPPQEVNFLVSKTSLADYSWLQEKEDAEFVAATRSMLIKKGSMLSLQ